MIGKTVSHYRITEQIGFGGMGVVYKAEDTKLKRTIALKFLPFELTRDLEAKARFIREAQAASVLEHPNICNIHEIDETSEGQLYFVMACYKGETLKDKIKDQSLKIKEVIDIVLQIAEGLAKAHEKGIVHRDIKPANIFVTNDGQVKILDFGLAKLAGQVQLTKDSSTLGTVAYMSPEQFSGKGIDQRTDIWSLGVVLYEMLTGELPFKGDYEQAIIFSILNEDPVPLTHFRTRVPNKLVHLVNKALSKNLKVRYRQIKEMIIDLKSIQKESQTLPRKTEFSILKPQLFWYTLSALLLLVLIIIGYWLTGSEENAGFRIKHTQPLTTAPGLEQDPSWSPDGSRIAYASDENGNMDIWVCQIAARQRVNLTKDYDGYDGKPAWSPDGEWIAFISDRDRGGLYLIPALGGIPKRVVSISFAPSLSYIGSIPPVCWSPNGEELVYADAGVLYKVPANGGTPLSMPLPSKGFAIGYSEPVWSPDGERIVCTEFVATGVATSQICSFQCDGTNLISLTEGKNFDHNPAWSSDGKQLFFISDRGGSLDIWWIPADAREENNGRAHPLTTGIGIGNIALSKDGSKLVYSKITVRNNIWSVPIIPDRLLTLADAQPLTTENHYIDIVTVAPDGNWIAFDSNRSGNQDIWIMHKDGSELRQLTTSAAHDWVGSWSPDGTQIFFHSIRYGNRDIFMMPVAGGAVKQLTSHPAEDMIPVCSPDGEKIAFVSNRSGNLNVWVMPINGGKPQQLTFHTAGELVCWSPNGKQLVFSSKHMGHSELYLIPSEGGDPIQITHGKWLAIGPCYWSADGLTIYAWGIGGPGNAGYYLWAVSVSDGTARSLMDFSHGSKEPVLMSSDGKRIYFTLWECVGDLWMAELETIKEK